MDTADGLIFLQRGLPVFQNKVYGTAEAALAAVRGDVELRQCAASGLVFNERFDPALLDYDKDYQNEQACSPAFQRHLDQVRALLIRHFGLKRKGIEIGCGKGHFFEMLCKAGADVTGYDPAYEGDNPRIARTYFGHGVGVMQTPPDYIVLRHVLEHILSPWDFLEQLAAQCGDRTKIYIEVPCFDWIVRQNAFYDVFYEHVNYFTHEVLNASFSCVHESGNFFGGQYLYLVADLGSFSRPVQFRGKRFSRLRMEEYLSSLLQHRRQNTGRALIWGAGAKGTTFANLLLAHGADIDAIVDINPAKQDKFAGGSGLPILSPASAAQRLQGADVFVMNPVYFDEILAMVEQYDANLISVA